MDRLRHARMEYASEEVPPAEESSSSLSFGLKDAARRALNRYCSIVALRHLRVAGRSRVRKESLSDNLQPIFFRHPKIEQKDVRRKLIIKLGCFLVISGFSYDLYVVL